MELLARLDPSQIAEGGIAAASPFQSADIDFLSYPDGDTRAMYERTKQAIADFLDAGFAAGDIALIALHGRDRSRLLHLDRLGPHTLASFTGEYDASGRPVIRDGALRAESVYRFMGQSMPAVILTEIEFDQLDQQAFHKLFVGMTRARLRLILVLSDGAAAALMSRLA
jgi:superfamily I DNA and RNA helicase